MVRLVRFRFVIVDANSRAEEGSGEESARASEFYFFANSAISLED